MSDFENLNEKICLLKNNNVLLLFNCNVTIKRKKANSMIILIVSILTRIVAIIRVVKISLYITKLKMNFSYASRLTD